MQEGELLEILGALPEGRTLYYYYPGRFAVALAADEIGDARVPISELRARLPALLAHPVFKEALAKCGDGWVSAEQLRACWLPQTQPFLLTLAAWGSREHRPGWNQTSRRGFNLVLRLDFSTGAMRQIKTVMGSDAEDFNFDIHPVNQPGNGRRYRETLAWARIDCDFATDEALIEEVQSDWVQSLEWYWQNDFPVSSPAARRLDRELGRPSRWWSEAMLSAAVGFIWHELGIRNIYYHEFDTGRRLKRIGGRPPRSLYTKLPRRFGMTRVEAAPEFLHRDPYARRVLRRIRPYAFYTLDRPGQHSTNWKEISHA